MKTLKVIKIGGEIVDNSEGLDAFLDLYAQLDGPKILVHGGGKLATKLAKVLGIPVNMVNGRRITDLKTLEVATMVYAGKINKTIVSKLQSRGCNALGLTGADGNMIHSVKRPVVKIDFGYVGDIVQVNSQLILQLLSSGLSPVFCALTHDTKGQLLNTNADTIASEIGVALAPYFKVDLYYCFDKEGVLQDIDNPNSVISHINSQSFEDLKNTKVISDGMLPKLDNCFNALNKGIQTAKIGKPKMLNPQHEIYTTVTK